MNILKVANDIKNAKDSVEDVVSGVVSGIESLVSGIGNKTNSKLVSGISSIDDKGLVKGRTTDPQDAISNILDKDWARRTFMVSDGQLQDSVNVINRYHSTANLKFTDTRMGRNIGVNSRPQFTRYSDIRRPGRLSTRKPVTVTNTSGNFGMGRYYSEAIDDPAQNIYLRFGVPEYTSMLDFLSRAFDPEALHIAKTGRGRSVLFDIARAVGGYVSIVTFPQAAAIMFIGKIANTIFSKPRYKYYTLKPTMHNYWSCVNLLVNTIAANLKLLPAVIADNDTQLIGQPFKFQKEDLKLMHELLPDIIDEDGYIDVFAVALQGQVAANKIFLKEYDQANTSTRTNDTGYLTRGDLVRNFYVTDSIFVNDIGRRTLASFINKITSISEWFKSKDSDEEKGKAELAPNIDPNTGSFSTTIAKDPAKKTTFTEYLDAEFRSGSQYAIFKVDFTTGLSESFTSSIKESEISQKINSQVSQFRDMKFSVGQFKLPGALGDAIGKIAGGLGDLAAGAASGLTFGLSDAITSLMSNSYVDIPKHWQSSSVNLPRANYHMTLISPYGNPVSLLQNIYIPLAMLMAGTLPLAAGKGSYTSPFICELYDRGKIQIKLGMIESLTISRGTSNLGFSMHYKPLAIDVSLSVVDLSSIMSMPVAPAGIKDALMSAAGAPGAAVGGALGVYNPAIDEDSILSDYLAVLTGLDMYSQIYALPKGRLNAAKMMIKGKTLTSKAGWASLIGDSARSGILSYTPIGWFQFIVDGTMTPASIKNQIKY